MNFEMSKSWYSLAEYHENTKKGRRSIETMDPRPFAVNE